MKKYVKMFTVGATAVMLSGGAWFMPGTLSYAAEDGTIETTAATTAANTIKSELALESRNVAQGETFTVTVNLLENPGLTLADGILSYDTDVLELTSYTNRDGEIVYNVDSNDLFRISGYHDTESSLFTAPIPHDGKIRILDGYAKYQKNSDATGTMFTLTFKVKDDAAIGTTGTLGYEGIFFSYVSDTETKEYNTTADELTFKVVCPEAAHKYGEPVVDKEATCTTEGLQTLTCSVCGMAKTEEIAALGHDWGDVVVDKEATATEKGSQHYVCKRCGETKTEEIPALGNQIIYGDVNGDGEISLMDAALIRRWLVGWNVTIDEAAADVNADGTINIMDSALVYRYLAGWKVTLGQV